MKELVVVSSDDAQLPLAFCLVGVGGQSRELSRFVSRPWENC